jgi:hypothetical protein
VPTEPQSSTSLKFTADPRLAAAAAGVARYLAEAAGLESDAITKFQAATLTTCVAGARSLAEGEAQVMADVSRYADTLKWW